MLPAPIVLFLEYWGGPCCPSPLNPLFCVIVMFSLCCISCFVCCWSLSNFQPWELCQAQQYRLPLCQWQGRGVSGLPLAPKHIWSVP